MMLSTLSDSEVMEYLSRVRSSSTVWVLFTVCSVLTKCVPFLHKIGEHGKCKKHKEDMRSPGSKKSNVSRLQAFTDYVHDKLFIPKKWFVHLYLIGFGCALYHLYDCTGEMSLSSPDSLNSHLKTKENSAGEGGLLYSFLLPFLYPPPLLQLQVVLILWTCHVLRRLLESLFLTHYGDSRMHVAGFLAGIVHYITVPICFREASAAASGVSNSVSSGVSVDFDSSSFAVLMLLRVMACSLFVLANFYQFESHQILFQMKEQQRVAPDPSVYQLPTQSWFAVVCVPHYTAEVLVYLSLALLLLPLREECSGCWSPALLVVWVGSNLSVVAHKQHQWYLNQYPTKVPRPWYKLFPYIW